jgi:hypothetical protein
MFVAGVDGCHAGWIAFKVELPSRVTSVEVIDLPAWLKNRPPELAHLGIDIPIGLLDRPRRCDIKARDRLGWPRRASVFSSTVPGGFDSKEPRRGERDQSEEDGKRSEPTGVPHRVKNQASGRRNDAGSPAVGVRGSPRSLLLGAEWAAPHGARQEDRSG